MNGKLSIDDLSLADLKTTLDWVKNEIIEIEEQAKEKNMKPDKIASYQQMQSYKSFLENKLENIIYDLLSDPAIPKIPKNIE